MSPLQIARMKASLELPAILRDLHQVGFAEQAEKIEVDPEIRQLFPKTVGQPLLIGERQGNHATRPLRVGVVFSGGQAAGGHNVITGLYDALQAQHPNSVLLGFLNGPQGILDQSYRLLSRKELESYRNQGGFDLIGSGRTKIETDEQFELARVAVQALALDTLIIIGGDDSNTNAALLAEYFAQKGVSTGVLGIPKTIDGDLQNAHVEISFGFDTACRTYSETIGNIARDALSARKYYHVIRLMGRSASHIALECALATHPNAVLIGEEAQEKKLTLEQLTNELADIVIARAKQKKHFGVFLIPEGIIEFIPEMLQKQLGTSLDPHGNLQVSAIETERLFIQMISEELARRQFKEWNPVPHFLGYEGRAGFPSNFDCHYCYALGYTAALLAQRRATGYMCFIKHLEQPVASWEIGGAPLANMLHFEMRKGKRKPVIKKTLVDLKGKKFAQLQKLREHWKLNEDYLYPGPIQFPL